MVELAQRDTTQARLCQRALLSALDCVLDLTYQFIQTNGLPSKGSPLWVTPAQSAVGVGSPPPPARRVR